MTEHLHQIRQEGRKVLSLFVTAGYPTIESTVPLVVALANAGADLIELGIPFSDPIADGPTIQHSSETALRNGMTLQHTMDMAQEIRRQCSIPIVLMGYANPIYMFGLQRFVATSAGIGVDGIIIPDMPLEESEELQRVSKENNLATIFLAAPTTPDERLIQLDQHSTGFLYCVSITGVTGERRGLSNESEEFLHRARKCVKKNSLLVGFGIATPEDARRVSRLKIGRAHV